MNKFLFLAFLFFISCGKEKVIQLPEISHSKITEIKDVSPAYIFYDETKPDSTELNRKNLISTTHWLVNVDKRLTLKQAIPHIQFLQEKKNSSSHKNEAAKNFYTCNDTSIKNLGFIEFTDVIYNTYKDEIVDKDVDSNDDTYNFNIIIKSLDSIYLESYVFSKIQTNKTLIKELTSEIETLKSIDDPDHGSDSYSVNFCFNRSLTFQDYISIKSLFKTFKVESTTINNNEFIY